MIIHAYASTLRCGVWSPARDLESKYSFMVWMTSHYILGATTQWIVDLNKLNRPVLFYHQLLISLVGVQLVVILHQFARKKEEAEPGMCFFLYALFITIPTWYEL